VFTGSANNLAPLLVAFGDSTSYDPPVIMTSPVGTLLWIPGHMDSTGNFNTEQLYVRRDLDTVSWQVDPAHRLPDGLHAAKGIYPDYRTVTATTRCGGRPTAIAVPPAGGPRCGSGCVTAG
jgi:hypothetical protein